MKKLPIKSLIQFRSVSKSWRSLIDSSDFIAHYNRQQQQQQQQQQHLLVRYHKIHPYVQNFVSFVDDDTFPQQKLHLTTPLLVNMLEISSIIGSSQGLLCLLGHYREVCDPESELLVVWNISIRKAIAVVVPYVGDKMYRNVLGFWVCSETNDPKIVKINTSSDMESISCIPRQVEVFTLSTGAWRSSYSNLPRKSVEFIGFCVMVEETLYWLAMDRIIMDDGFGYCNLIVSFDVTSEEFKEVKLPDTLAHEQHYQNLSVSKLRNSLVVVELDEDEASYVVWMMEDGIISKSFTKLYSICTLDALIIGVLGFRKSGEPLVEFVENDCEPCFDSSVVVYERASKCITNLGIKGTDISYSVSSYMETLLLLDRPNSIIYGKDKCFEAYEPGTELMQHKMIFKLQDDLDS
ncbi:hypothetical protein QVD17_35334 [Tagetes erecta]|uniref:F-box domain-containing protein n=1 Tax=Tagetes erecta TaxID=13708 RepID=A0AAD8JZA4_TARER|nr:hypothetical protein QVD17_35334 [Tagetes erecta]